MCAFVLKQCSRLKASAESFGEYKMKKKREKESKKCRVPFFLHAANGAPNNKKQTALPDFMGN